MRSLIALIVLFGKTEISQMYLNLIQLFLKSSFFSQKLSSMLKRLSSSSLDLFIFSVDSAHAVTVFIQCFETNQSTFSKFSTHFLCQYAFGIILFFAQRRFQSRISAMCIGGGG